MSISCAPARTACSVSASLIGVKLWPDGKAVATEAILTSLPRRCSTQSAMRNGYTQTAATDGMVESPGLGRMALAHIAATLPGVSAPSSVVRSMQRIARSRAHSLEDFLIDRLASEAARSSAPTSSTLRTPRISDPRWVRERAAGPPLPLAVDHPSAATLDDHVYVAGGHSYGRDSARLFRLDSDHWTELASMHFARGGHGLVAAQGRLYAIGGNNSRGNVGPLEAYDPGSDTWSVLTALPAARNHVSGFVANGAACVAGGRSPTTGRVDCFDPASGAWSRLPDLPLPTR